MKLIAVIAFVLLCGCAQLQPIAESTDTFAVCKAADVITTGYALNTGVFVEKNPLIAPLVSSGIWPLALVSTVVWFIVDNLNRPDVTLAFNAITCPVAARNLLLLM